MVYCIWWGGGRGEESGSEDLASCGASPTENSFTIFTGKDSNKAQWSERIAVFEPCSLIQDFTLLATCKSHQVLGWGGLATDSK